MSAGDGLETVKALLHELSESNRRDHEEMMAELRRINGRVRRNEEAIVNYRSAAITSNSVETTGVFSQ